MEKHNKKAPLSLENGAKTIKIPNQRMKYQLGYFSNLINKPC